LAVRRLFEVLDVLKFLIIIDSYVYFLIPFIWFSIVIINTEIYRYYNNVAVIESRNNWEGVALVFFTFRWSLDGDEPNKIIRFKTAINCLSVYFVIHILISFSLWYYLKHNNPLNLWAGY
jgi:hypothetical protein